MRRIKQGIEKYESLYIIGHPDMSVLAFTSKKGDIFNIGDALSSKGWHLDRLQFPDALHLTVTQLNIGKEEEFLRDLEEIIGNDATLVREYNASKSSVKIARALAKILPSAIMDKLTRKAGILLNNKGKGNKVPQAAFYGITASFKNRKNVSRLVENLLDGMY
ncbi:MAG: hypothetical protein KAR19_02135 [Bacteroidales bacterium]|nr:hypothetical protein [Bacteroidales bacterium]